MPPIHQKATAMLARLLVLVLVLAAQTGMAGAAAPLGPPGAEVQRNSLPTGTRVAQNVIKTPVVRGTITIIFEKPVEISLSPAEAPGGTVGWQYSGIKFSANGGKAPYRISVIQGELPSGLVLNRGTLTGTPRQAGRFDFTVQAIDSSKEKNKGTRAYSILIDAPVEISLSPAETPGGTEGERYSGVQFKPSGGQGRYRIELIEGSLPPGLVLNRGKIAGTPRQAGQFGFTVRATDRNGAKGQRDYTITIDAPPEILIGPSEIPGATKGQAYSGVQFEADGGTPAYSLAISSGSLPAGMTMARNGTLSGNPQQAGVFNFTVTATDARKFKGSQNYALFVEDPPQIAVSPAEVPPGAQGQPYRGTQFRASGGTAPHSFSVSNGNLPPGLTMNTGGSLAGTPQRAGRYNFSVTATDQAGFTGARAYNLTINAPTQIAVSPAELPPGNQGQPYRGIQFRASGGTPPHQFSIAGGALPPGLVVTPQGLLGGTPAQAGNFSVTVMATDQRGASGQRTYPVQIGAAVNITISPAELLRGQHASPYPQTQFIANGGQPPYTYSLTTGTALPPGMQLSPAGILSGVPNAPSGGSFGFSVTATDRGGATGARNYSLLIAPGQVAVANQPQQQPPGGNPCPPGQVLFGQNCVDDGSGGGGTNTGGGTPTGGGNTLTVQQPTGGGGGLVQEPPRSGSGDLAKKMQRALKRVGCYRGGIDGDFGRGSKAALAKFVRLAGLRLSTTRPTQRAINAANAKPRNYCRTARPKGDPKPPVHGCPPEYDMVNGRCVCAAGYFENSAGDCIKKTGTPQCKVRNAVYDKSRGGCVCRKGYVPQGNNRCVKKRRTPQCEVANAVYDRNRGGCVCRKGYVQQGSNRCVKKRRQQRGASPESCRRGGGYYNDETGRCACEGSVQKWRNGRCVRPKQGGGNQGGGRQMNSQQCAQYCTQRALRCMKRHNDKQRCIRGARRCTTKYGCPEAM